jgi:hypothetical protein
VAALRPRQRQALDGICDTFHPGTAELGASDAFLELFGSQLRPAELRQLGWLLSLFGVRRFERLSQERRERILLAWCNSRLVTRRAAFHGFRKAALALAYGLPAQDRAEPDVGADRLRADRPRRGRAAKASGRSRRDRAG